MIKIIKLLIGGSPCTHWSIAQKKNRETTASGIGWELFKNYLYAKERFKPDLFLYENNKSASPHIKDQISEELGVDLMHINSALVSAQHRQRFYAFNWNVERPQDRGILLKDIIESGIPWNDKAYCLTASYNGAIVSNTLERKQRTMIAESVRIGTFPSSDGKIKNSQGMRIYSINGKSVTLCGNGGGLGAKTGLYAIPTDEEPTTSIGTGKDRNSIKRVYEVKDGETFINGKSYPIALDDGYYIIRKLTVKECCRLQTLPDDYCKAVSKTQAYKGLGNGWTAEVIIHILSGALKNVDRNEKIVVLSMYDGIGTGRYCLDKMGFKNVEYYAFEIDKFAMKVANDNYPNIIQFGDAFQMRDNAFNIHRLISGMAL